MKRGPIAALKKRRDDKRQWRAHVARTKKLPPSYRLVMEEIQKFMWNFAWDDTMVATFDDILDLLEEGAAAGRPVLEVTGDDVAGFAQSILAEMQARTWQGKKAEQLNARVHAKLDQEES